MIRRELTEHAKDFSLVLDDIAITELSFSPEYEPNKWPSRKSSGPSVGWRKQSRNNDRRLCNLRGRQRRRLPRCLEKH